MSIFEALLEPKSSLERKKARGLTHPDTLAHPVTKDDGSDTVHVHLQTPETLKGDLSYLADKLGVDLEKLREERYQEEQQAKQAETDKRREKKERARLAREAALDKEFLENYGSRDGHYSITLNGKRIQKLKSFDETVCPVCGVCLNLSGLARSIVEQNDLWSHPFNPLSSFYYSPCRIDTARCPNRHENNVIVQYIL